MWNKKRLSVIGVFIGLSLVLTACGNYNGTRTRQVIIQPSETAFVINANEASDQAKIQSQQYLESKKVAARQIQVTYDAFPIKKDNRMFHHDVMGYRPDNLVYIVERGAQGREWTQDGTSGTNGTNQAFKLESNEAIDFYLGMTCTGQVTEVDASNFLYNFNANRVPVDDPNFKDVQPAVFTTASVAAVMDNQVRNAFEARLFADFHNMTYNDIRLNAGNVIAKATVDITKDFEGRGLTLTNCGGQGGIAPTDPKIQQSINDTYSNTQQNQRDQATAQNQKAVAQANLDAQTIKNQQAISQAQNDAAVAKARQDQEIAYQKQLADLLKQNPDLTQYALAQKWNGQPPQVTSQTSAPYVSVGTPTPSSGK